MEPLPEKYLGKDLHDKLYVNACFGNLGLLKYELSEEQWNNKINIWLNKLDLEEDFDMAFSVVDALKTINIHQINIDKIHKAYNRREVREIRNSKNSFLYYYAKTNGEKNSLLNSLKN